MHGLEPPACLLSALVVAACGSRTSLDFAETLDARAPASDVAGSVDDSMPLSAGDGGVDGADGPNDAAADGTADAVPLTCGDSGNSVAYVVTVEGALYTIDPTTATTAFVTMLSCPAAGSLPFTMAVSPTGVAYVLYNDFNIYRVDLSTFACAPTLYVQNQLGIVNPISIAVAPGVSESMFYYGGTDRVDVLATSDLTSLVLSEVGPVVPDPDVIPLELKADEYGRLFGLNFNGLLVQIDPSTGRVLGQNLTGFDSPGDWALLTFDGGMYFFGSPAEGKPSTEYRYDLATNAIAPVGTLSMDVVGAGAAPCAP